MLRYFFSYIDDIPSDLHNTIFSAQHLLSLAMVFCSWAILTLIFKDKQKNKKWRLLILLSLVLPLLECLQILWYKSINQFSWGYTLPLHLCSLMSVILPVMTVTRSRLLQEYAYAMGLAPAFMTLLTPDIYYYPSFSFIYVLSMLGHGIICFIPIFLVIGMGFRPEIRNLPKVIGMLVGFALLIVPVNSLTGGNYFFLRYPAPGSPMEYFETFAGNPGYLVPTFFLGCVLWAILYAPFVILKAKEKRRVNASADDGEPAKQHAATLR